MSVTSRNAPCPCGSGRKYKRCCLAKDLARQSGFRLLGLDDDPAAVRAEPVDSGSSDAADDPSHDAPAGTWQMDIVSLPGTMERGLITRSALGLVVESNGIVIAAEAIASAPNELDDVAAAYESLLAIATDRMRRSPRQLHVRHPEIRAILARRLRDRGLEVRTFRKLSSLDRARRSFASDVVGVESELLSTCFGPWSQWAAPRDVIADVFAAAGAYWHAAPWRLLSDAETLRIVVRDGKAWYTSILGHAGEVYGLALYEQASDVDRIQRTTNPSRGLPSLHGQTLGLTFDHRRSLPREFASDAKRNGWSLPDADILPTLSATNTPAGGVTRRQFRDLAAALRSIAAFVEVLPERVKQQATGFWTHDATGVSVIYDPAALAVALSSVPPETLSASGPEGPRAEPAARLDLDRLDEEAAHEMKIVDRFDAWHDASDEALRHSDRMTAELFMRFLSHHHALPYRAVTEYELRVFLHDFVHRKAQMSDEAAYEIPGALRRFFDFLAECEGIVCPWAAAVIDDAETFRRRRSTFPGGFWWDPGVAEWRQELVEALTARALVPSTLDDDDIGGPPTVGPVEARLLDQLQRLWLIWRDEIIRAGTTAYDDVVDELIERQDRWQATPNPLTNGATPRSAVAKERKNAAKTR